MTLQCPIPKMNFTSSSLEKERPKRDHAVTTAFSIKMQSAKCGSLG